LILRKRGFSVNIFATKDKLGQKDKENGPSNLVTYFDNEQIK
jgi:hypothetical protein